MVAVELGLEAEAIVKRARRRVACLDLQAETARALLPPPGREAGDNPPAETLAAPPRVGDDRLVAEEPITDRAIGKRRETTLDAQPGEGGGDRDSLDDAAVNRTVRLGVALELRHGREPFRTGLCR